MVQGPLELLRGVCSGICPDGHLEGRGVTGREEEKETRKETGE